MKRQCSDSECIARTVDLNSSRLVRKGTYWRRSDGQRITRYFCLRCRKSSSSAGSSSCYRQKKRKLNHQIALLLISGVSQRRAALILGINRKTVVRKFRFLAAQARIENKRFQNSIHSLSNIQFDDLETSEHSKCKPLSVALAVEPKTRKILSFQVSEMPAKGLLARVAIRKYGLRKDKRSTGWNVLFRELKPMAKEDCHFLSDQNPHYEMHLKRHFPRARHQTVKGGRGCVAGQGELKKLHFDPLFSLNHTCAMLRANLNRLMRRTWCTTKTKQGLMDHLALYVAFHNRCLTGPMNKQRGQF